MIIRNREMIVVTFMSVAQNIGLDKHRNNVKEIMTSNIKLANDVEIVELCKHVIRLCDIITDGITDMKTAIDFIRTNDTNLMMELENRCINETLTNSVLNSVTNYYASLISYKPIIDKKEEIIDAYMNFSVSSFGEGAEAIHTLDSILSKTKNTIDSVKESDNPGKTLLVEYDHDIGLKESIKELRYENEVVIKTGTPLDELFGGGIRPNKSYIFAGLSGMFKSGTLLNIALGIKDSNEHLTADKFEGKIPIVPYFTFEVTRAKTLSRILAYYGYNKDDIEKMNDEVMESLVQKLLRPKSPDGFRVVIKEFRSNTVTDAQLRMEVKMLEDKGYKVLAIVDDYLRLHKVEYSEVDKADKIIPVVKSARACRNTAIDFGAAFISGAQLNREGEKEFKAAMRKHMDALKNLDASFLAGAHALKDELDALVFLARAKYDGRDFIAFKSDKDRDNDNESEELKKKGINDYMVCEFENGFKIGKTFHKSVIDMFPSIETTTGVFAASAKSIMDEMEAFEKEANGDVTDDYYDELDEINNNVTKISELDPQALLQEKREEAIVEKNLKRKVSEEKKKKKEALAKMGK
ncbi:MAG: DnaB family ATPase [Peptostreptococcaceae bacterium]